MHRNLLCCKSNQFWTAFQSTVTKNNQTALLTKVAKDMLTRILQYFGVIPRGLEYVISNLQQYLDNKQPSSLILKIHDELGGWWDVSVYYHINILTYLFTVHKIPTIIQWNRSSKVIHADVHHWHILPIPIHCTSSSNHQPSQESRALLYSKQQTVLLPFNLEDI